MEKSQNGKTVRSGNSLIAMSAIANSAFRPAGGEGCAAKGRSSAPHNVCVCVFVSVNMHEAIYVCMYWH